MDIAQFRLDFPEFTDVARYPDSMVTFWSNLGEQMISADRFGTVYTQAVELYTAHNISLAAQNVVTSGVGGQPGTVGGSVQSKSVGSASVSYDVNGSLEKNAGFWNQTVYGRQYISLVNLFGQGGYQL